MLEVPRLQVTEGVSEVEPRNITLSEIKKIKALLKPRRESQSSKLIRIKVEREMKRAMVARRGASHL